MTACLLGLALAVAVPPEAPPAAAAPAAERKDTPEWRAARKHLTTMLALLTALSALVMLLGYAILVRRWGRRVAKRADRLPVKYFDLTVPPEPPPPHEPSAEERFLPPDEDSIDPRK